jgi:hypothetical protein
MLEDVLKQISDFDALKLPELKGELEGFVKKQQGLVDDYKKVYPDLKRRWLAQHTDVQTLYTQLKTTHDPLKDPWKDLVSKCICAKQKEVDCLGEAIRNRKRCSSGKLEYEWEQAKDAFTAAKWRLDVLLALAAKLDAALTADGNWIKSIQTLPAPDRVTVLYLFWVRLLPAHRALKPADLPRDCPVPGDDETPEKICKTEWDAKCPADAWACIPPASTGGAAWYEGRSLPWLIPADAYEGALDCAWDAYRQAKNKLAIAEAAFKATPDDLATNVKRHTAAKDALEAEILKCLKTTWTPTDPCAETAPTEERGV